jgi:hypothetical protein
MLFINKKNQFAMSLQGDEDINKMEVFDDEAQHLLASLMNVLIHGNLTQLNQFARDNPIEIDSTFRLYLFIYAMDKVKFENLMWLGNFLDIDLVNAYKADENSNTSIEEALIPNLIGASFVYKPDYSVMISNLKDMGFNLNQQYMDGFTLLHFVSSYNGADRKVEQSAIRALLDNGADPNVKNAYGKSSLACASNGEIANYLVQQDECNPVFKYTKTNKSVAISSTEFKNKRIYAYCLEHGGVDVAISRIESGLLANLVSEVCNSKVNNPAPRRI